MVTPFARTLLAALLLAFASLSIAQAPQYRSAATLNGSGSITFPAGSASSDWLVMYVISTATVATPAGWTLKAQRNWTAYAYTSYVFTRQKGSDSSVTVTTTQGGSMILAYQNASGIGAVGTLVEANGTTLALSSITPQHAGSVILGLVSDRDPVPPTPAAGYTSRLNFTTTYFGQAFADKAYGSTAPTGTVTWTQSNTYPAVGVLIELLPNLSAPAISTGFTPATILTGSVSTVTFSLTNVNGAALTNANFTDALTHMSVAHTAIGGTCAATTNSPALTFGATALNLTIPSLPAGGCTVTVQVTSTSVGTHPNATSGVTTTEVPTAGAASNTANLTVRSTPLPATIATAFSPAWIATGGTSTLTFTLTSPSGVGLTNANFTDLFTNMTVASAAIGGTCAGTTNSPALTVGATGVNLTVPTLPAGGCTVTVQVTSATLGANGNVTSAVTSTETTDAGVASNTAYVTVNPVDVGFLYVHADHLGTPRAITRPSDNAKVWAYENTEPFGNSSPNENPLGFGNFVYNMRESWQYHDQETGTRYNTNRDYDPATGRYIQSDPIGLKGGISTYGFVAGNPLVNVDRSGTDYWTETGNTDVSGGPLHRRVCVGKPGGIRFCISFGILKEEGCNPYLGCEGSVYYDSGKPGLRSLSEYRYTDAKTDSAVGKFLNNLRVTKAEYYLIGRNCRDFADALFGYLNANFPGSFFPMSPAPEKKGQ